MKAHVDVSQMNDLKILALIIARGGSKSIPKKNIMDFKGKPLIAHSIEQAISSKYINKIVVSTDCPDIAKVSNKSGAEVPFMRPDEIAQDNTPDLPVFIHALNWLKENQNYIPDYVIHLRVTSPYRPNQMIDKGIELLLKKPEADSLRCVCEPEHNPYKMWTINNDETMSPLLSTNIFEAYNKPRQELPPVYWQTGQLDIIKTETITQKNSMTGEIIVPFIIDKRDAVDIDDDVSLAHALKVFK